MCEWNEVFPVVVADIECVIHHCGHPHTGQFRIFYLWNNGGIEYRISRSWKENEVVGFVVFT